MEHERRTFVFENLLAIQSIEDFHEENFVMSHSDYEGEDEGGKERSHPTVVVVDNDLFLEK